MGHNSSYLEATKREVESRKLAGLLIYVLTQLGRENEIDDTMRKTSEDYYGNVALYTDYVNLLTWLIHTMTDDQFEQIVYNAHNRIARAVADWWEKWIAEEE